MLVWGQYVLEENKKTKKTKKVIRRSSICPFEAPIFYFLFFFIIIFIIIFFEITNSLKTKQEGKFGLFRIIKMDWLSLGFIVSSLGVTKFEDAKLFL